MEFSFWYCLGEFPSMQNSETFVLVGQLSDVSLMHLPPSLPLSFPQQADFIVWFIYILPETYTLKYTNILLQIRLLEILWFQLGFFLPPWRWPPTQGCMKLLCIYPLCQFIASCGGSTRPSLHLPCSITCALHLSSYLSSSSRPTHRILTTYPFRHLPTLTFTSPLLVSLWWIGGPLMSPNYARKHITHWHSLEESVAQLSTCHVTSISS